MGSYIENGKTIHMVRILSTYGQNGMEYIAEHIIQVDSTKDIVCLKQQEPTIEGQMSLIGEEDDS